MLAEFAPLYEAAAARGLSSAALDEMELWQVGAALGMVHDSAFDGRSNGSPTAALPKEYLEARARAVAEGLPLPDPPVVGAPSTRPITEQVPQVARR